ncbi:hypothetical protein [Herbiconiux liukaitaii]|uniref:hypothetical protein n=1 Tax=Herbiconiux liukaitaii TaxID=3342799 RepID=UPI0035B7BB90
MRKKIAVAACALAGVAVLVSGALIGAGMLTAASAQSQGAPVPVTVLDDGSVPVEEQTPSPVVSNLPAAMIAGLPEYSAEHDRETYIRVQTWIKICMGEQAGHSYSFEPAPAEGDVTGLVSTGFIPFPAEFDQHEQIALYGEADNLLPAYDWNRGGCYGEALHKAGLLDGGVSTFSESELARIADVYESMAYPPAETSGGRGAPGDSVDATVFATIDAAITTCMAEHGIDHSHMPASNPDGSVSLRNGSFSWEPISGERTESFYDDALVTLFGQPQAVDAPYDWSEGGCYGEAIHEAGIAGAE